MTINANKTTLMTNTCLRAAFGRRMRSTQFDEHSPIEEEAGGRVRNRPDTLCERIKRLGYARNNQVRLYGDVYDLVSDPVWAQ